MAKRKYFRIRGKKLSKKKIESNIKIIILLIYSLVLLSINEVNVTINAKVVEAEAETAIPVEVEEERGEIIVTPQASANMTVEEQIRAIAAEKNFKWADYLVRLADCESTLNPNAINDKNRNGTIDWGLFQWNSKNPPIPITKECAFDLRCSTERAIEAINLRLSAPLDVRR